MEKWTGRVALVTGASSGIGRAIALKLAQHKMKVVAVGRNIERLQALAEEAFISNGGKIIPVQCDVRDERSVQSVFSRIRADDQLGCVDVCVNNAGLLIDAPLLTGTTEQWKEQLEVNVLASCICSRESVKLMREKNVDDGFIINLCSMAGHRVKPNPMHHFYCATKFFIKSMSEGLVNELYLQKSNIRVMQISPAKTETEIFERALGTERSNQILNSTEPLKTDDITDCVIYGLSAPSHVLITDVLIRPTEQLD